MKSTHINQARRTQSIFDFFSIASLFSYFSQNLPSFSSIFRNSIKKIFKHWKW